MTTKICDSEPGFLTSEMLDVAPEIMHAWAHNPYNDKSNEHAKECALTVERLVKRLVDERRAGNPEAIATTEDYNTVLEGWSRSGLGIASAERCEQILTEMQKEDLTRPDLTSFKAALLAWQQSDEDFAPLRAQRLLEWMIKLNEMKENFAKPDGDAFDIVLQTWAKSGRADAPQQAEALVMTMERYSRRNRAVAPHTRSFNSVLAAWSKRADPEAVKRTLDILSWMEKASEAGNRLVNPDIVSYSTVLRAISKAGGVGAAKACDDLLKKVETGYKNGNQRLCPDAQFYNQVLHAWASSRKLGSHRKARTVLKRQQNMYERGVFSCRPDVIGHTSVIAACANQVGVPAAEKRDVYKIALEIFEQLKECPHDNPNHVTYGTLIKACGKLLPAKTKNKEIRRIFNECAEHGYVGQMVLSALRQNANPVYKEVMAGKSRKSIPIEWSCNVHGDRRKPMNKRRFSPKKAPLTP